MRELKIVTSGVGNHLKIIKFYGDLPIYVNCFKDNHRRMKNENKFVVLIEIFNCDRYNISGDPGIEQQFRFMR